MLWVASSAHSHGAHGLVDVHMETQSGSSSALGLFRKRPVNLCFQGRSGVTGFPDGSQYPQAPGILLPGREIEPKLLKASLLFFISCVLGEGAPSKCR